MARFWTNVAVVSIAFTYCSVLTDAFVVNAAYTTANCHHVNNRKMLSQQCRWVYGVEKKHVALNMVENVDYFNEEQQGDVREFEDHVPAVNIVTLVGRVGQAPSPKYFDDGKVVLNLSLAVTRKYHPLERKVRNIKYGEEETDWFPLELWGRDAEFAAKYVTKGCRIGITGTLGMNVWVGREDGKTKRRVKILVKHLDILESRAESELRRGTGGSTATNKGGYYDNDGDDGARPSSAGTGDFFD